jgi:hypothetical protein
MCITEQTSIAWFNAAPYSTVLNTYKYCYSRTELTGASAIQLKELLSVIEAITGTTVRQKGEGMVITNCFMLYNSSIELHTSISW